MRKKLHLSFLFLLFLLLVLSACKGEKKEEPDKKKITIMGAIASEDEIARLEACIQPFIDRTGIEVEYEGSKEFESLIFVRTEAGNPPDIAMVPQPGNVVRMARQGYLTKMNQKTLDNMKKNYSQSWIDLVTVDGEIYGVIHRVNIKSIIWYPKKAWAKAGYTPPKTWDELKALCEKMKANGHVPWGIGIESGRATGWPATDWIEDILLRSAGPDIYDQWINHEIPFNHPAVKKAVEIMSEMWFTDGYVYGGRQNIPTLSFGDSSAVLFDDPPKAMMHRQGNFITNFFPPEIQENIDEEVGIFVLPSIDPQFGTPILGGGDLFVAFNDRPEVHEFMHYFTTSEAGEAWTKDGGALFAYKDQNLDYYPSDVGKELAKILINAEIFRFDGSDLMPSAVGAGSFWQEMVNYVVGTKELDDVLNDIEDSWPE